MQHCGCLLSVICKENERDILEYAFTNNFRNAIKSQNTSTKATTTCRLYRSNMDNSESVGELCKAWGDESLQISEAGCCVRINWMKGWQFQLCRSQIQKAASIARNHGFQVNLVNRMAFYDPWRGWSAWAYSMLNCATFDFIFVMKSDIFICIPREHILNVDRRSQPFDATLVSVIFLRKSYKKRHCLTYSFGKGGE